MDVLVVFHNFLQPNSVRYALFWAIAWAHDPHSSRILTLARVFYAMSENSLVVLIGFLKMSRDVSLTLPFLNHTTSPEN